MKIIVIGANGQLGTDLVGLGSAHGHEIVPVTHRICEVSDRSSVQNLVQAHRPDVVINTAAFHKLDQCHTDPARAFQVNGAGPQFLAEACQDSGAIIIHYSTDYVFDGGGTTPYREEDPTAPVNIYGISKVAGEQVVRTSCERSFILRTCGLYGQAGSSGKGGNFVENMIGRASSGAALKVVDDQVLTPSSTVDVASATYRLLSTNAFGTYHLTNSGECSWYSFTCKIFALAGIKAELLPVKTDAFPSPIRRPAYSVLAKDGLKRVGLDPLPDWEDALERYLVAKGWRG